MHRREIFLARTKNPPDRTRIHSLWEKILTVLQNNRRGPLPSFISTNYIAVLQKGLARLKPHSRQSG